MAPAIVQAAGAVALEATSVVWVELSLFAAAGLVYALVAGMKTRAAPIGKKHQKQLKGEDSPRGATPGAGNKQEHARVYAEWTAKRLSPEAAQLDLASVFGAMQKRGMSAADIKEEVKSALLSNEPLLTSLVMLPQTLLRDGAPELLTIVIDLLEASGRTPDLSVYAGLMATLLRRRDYAGVAASGSRLPSESITSKMRAHLAAAAAQRGLVDEVLEHVRQIPALEEGQRCALSSATAFQMLTLALKECRLPEVTEQLSRVGGRIEVHHIEDLLQSDGRRRGCSARDTNGVKNKRELLDAIIALQTPQSPGMHLVMALKFSHDGDGAGLRALLTEIEASGAVNESLALALLEGCKAIKGGDLICRILELHKGASASGPGAKVLTASCSALVSCDRFSLACDVYEKEMAPKGLWPDAAVTSALLKASAQCGRASLAQRLADHASSAQSSNGSSSGNAELQRQATMIKAHARERDLAAARGVFDRLKASGKELSPLVYNCFLDALVYCGDYEGGLQHFEDMKKLKFADVVGYNTMLKAHLGRGNTTAGRALVKEMVDRGLQPNKVTYNELLHATVMSKDTKGLWNIVDEMHASGLKANPITCSILLKSLTASSKCEDVRRIVELIDEVEEPIDEVLLSSVIESCIRIRQLDLLSGMLQRYKQKGGSIRLSAPTYGSMIKAYGQNGDVARVRELWNEMDERDVKPTAITLGCMTEALVQNNQAEEAWQLLRKQLESEERRGCINTVIYSTVLKGFAFSKRIDKVFAIYKEMRSNGVPCNTITYNTMLDACAKCSAMSRASSLLQDMKETAVTPDIITYSTIIKGYCLEGDVDRAFSILEEMKNDSKFEPDEIMYNSVLDGCAKQHRVEDALRLLDEMKAAGICPSNYTLSILVKLLGHARRLGQAFRMVDELSKQHGFRPNVQVYTCLVQACILNRRLEQALELHDTMVSDSGCKVDEKFYAVLARGCLQMNQPLKALQVVRAAYQLPGHSLGQPARKGRPVGIDPGALAEVAAKLQAGGKEERDALATLKTQLQDLGVEIGRARSYGNGRNGDQRRRGGERPNGGR
eukprot:TRINITY_DN2022_c2_g3_i1.p1 TRINITY_DN2022_c2_g3~~TRINITY_DN2022_c2_g3_i1.p1  ORF type:complete len:1064 (-),score=241.45 TRINITY_DN2022_c2_g3_i1:64-3255(-)